MSNETTTAGIKVAAGQIFYLDGRIEVAEVRDGQVCYWDLEEDKYGWLSLLDFAGEAKLAVHQCGYLIDPDFEHMESNNGEYSASMCGWEKVATPNTPYLYRRPIAQAAINTNTEQS